MSDAGEALGPGPRPGAEAGEGRLGAPAQDKCEKENTERDITHATNSCFTHGEMQDQFIWGNCSEDELIRSPGKKALAQSCVGEEGNICAQPQRLPQLQTSAQEPSEEDIDKTRNCHKSLSNGNGIHHGAKHVSVDNRRLSAPVSQKMHRKIQSSLSVNSDINKKSKVNAVFSQKPGSSPEGSPQALLSGLCLLVLGLPHCHCTKEAPKPCCPGSVCRAWGFPAITLRKKPPSPAVRALSAVSGGGSSFAAWSARTLVGLAGPDAAALVEQEGWICPLRRWIQLHLLVPMNPHEPLRPPMGLTGPDAGAPVEGADPASLFRRTGPDTPAAGLRGLGAAILWLRGLPFCHGEQEEVEKPSGAIGPAAAACTHLQSQAIGTAPALAAGVSGSSSTGSESEQRSGRQKVQVGPITSSRCERRLLALTTPQEQGEMEKP
ncbi:hypothetical protein QTO34_004808 [Cnephaeus nilssonii]|uniref:MyoD family inhibitor domain-containing protein n=1 Tax=Cnephaeus nilssonii TaxID=3371016 RepID=A0AA40HPZ4_CNENI|nr:hypothetical protein QTO34_004808 [Eptesicus nilssonii]